jgi:tRNA pseudouridine13 synthase
MTIPIINSGGRAAACGYCNERQRERLTADGDENFHNRLCDYIQQENESMQWTWPRTAPAPLTAAVMRVTPEDFRVEELMRIEPEGKGEHLWVRVCKRNWNTDQVARQLARLAGISPRAVGYAGMKDRRAVTVQWFSLQLPGRADPVWEGLPPGIEVLAAVRHSRKLQRGALVGNRFDIVLRDCAGDAAGLVRRLAAIGHEGVPNYFGEQRFGRDGGNIARAGELFSATGTVPDRLRRGIYLSAARAFLFNEVLAERIRAGNWQTPLPGEACLLAGSNSFFVIDAVDDVIQKRLKERDIHLGGPLWGEGDLPTRAVVQTIEQTVAARHPELVAGLAQAGLRQERRALRVIPGDVEIEALDAGSWRLRFSLPSGSYATAVLRELADYRVAETNPLEDDEA